MKSEHTETQITTDPTVTFYKSITDTSKPVHVELSKVIQGMKSDKYGIHEMRKKGVTDQDKKSLPVVCFNGKFQERLKTSLIEPSCCLILDFDGKDIGDVEKFRQRLKNNEYVHVLFTSPSGNGLKAIIRIPRVRDDSEFKEYFNALQVKFPQLDKSGKDINRACFWSYDPDLFHNPESEIWETKLSAPRQRVNKSDIKNDYGIINRCANIIQGAIEGERHDKILKASILAGGFAASGEIDRDEAERILTNVANQINPDEPWINQKTVLDGVAEGMLRPLKGDSRVNRKELEGELKTEELEQRLGKIYYTAEDVADEISHLWENGRSRGYDIYFRSSNEFISFKPGCTTYFYGQEYSGKSQVNFEIAIQLAHKHGLNFAIFSPESGRAAEIYAELMQMYVSKDFYEGSNRMTEQERDEAYLWVAGQFIVVDPSDNVFTISDFYEYVNIIERVYATRIDFTIVDPWNEFYHEWNKMGRDIYIGERLSEVRKNASATNRHNIVVTHTKDLELITERDSGIRYYPPPTRNQVANGQEWARKGQQMIAVWRPREGLKDEHGIPYGKFDTMVYVQKSKPKGIGKTGCFKLQYDPSRHRYFEPGNYNGQAVFYAILEKENEALSEDDSNVDIWKSASIDSFEEDTPF